MRKGRFPTSFNLDPQTTAFLRELAARANISNSAQLTQLIWQAAARAGIARMNETQAKAGLKP